MSDQDSKNTGQADQAQQEVKPLFTIGERTYDAEAAAKKILNADSHISTLESESKAKEARIQELEAELAQKDDLSLKLDQALSNLNQQPATETTSSVDLQKLEQGLLEKSQKGALDILETFEKQKLERSNMETNIEAAKKVFGTEYESKLRDLGSRFGMDDAGLQNLAKGSPEFFKQVFGLNKPVQESTAPQQNLSFSQKARSFHQTKSNRPDPTKAFDGHSRAAMMAERLAAKAKEKGLN